MRTGATIAASLLIVAAACSSVDSYLPDASAAGTSTTTTVAAGTSTTSELDPTTTPTTSTTPQEPESAPSTAPSLLFSATELRGRLGVEVIETLPHDESAFTQGLEMADGVLLESTGLYGASSRRRASPATGDTLRAVPLDGSRFGTGLTVHDGTIVQLTWRSGVAEVAAVDSLEPLDEIGFDGEGWGICATADHFVTSNGTDRLTIRDVVTFDEVDSVTVTLDGEPITRIAELECVGDMVWATVWLTADIILVDLSSGEVVAIADASSLVPPGVGRDDVLSAIAHDPSSDTYFLTGKRWDALYRVSFNAG